LAPLHHADWRFLLPGNSTRPYDLLVLFGGQPGLASRLADVGVARRVVAPHANAPSADLVAVLRDSRSSLREAAALLRPGGVLYLEVDRRRPATVGLTPGRARRRLEALGITPLASYAALPTFATRKVFLPLESEAAFRWFARTLYPPTTPGRRMLETALRLASMNGTVPAFAVPCFCIVGVAGKRLDGRLAPLAHPGLPSRARRPEVRTLLLADQGNRAVMLPFAIGDEEPAAALKIPKLPEFNDRTENDQATLERIRERLDPPLRRSLPTPLGTYRSGDVSITAERYLSGRPLSSTSGRWGGSLGEKLDDLHLAAHWLGDFHRQMEVRRPPWGVGERRKWIEDPLTQYDALFRANDTEKRLFNAVSRRAEVLGGASLPIVLLHRDFNVWNLFRDGEELRVIDWEGARPGLALCDLLHFVTHWHEAARGLRSRTSRLRGFRRLFCEHPRSDPAGVAVHQAIGQYMAALQIDARFYPLLLVYTWVEMALRRAEQQRLQSSLTENARSGNHNVDLIGILAGCTERIFAESTAWTVFHAGDAAAGGP
jgi:hypothetical protein